MRQFLIGVAIALAAGCGGEEEEPPTCDQAILHYYMAGCAFYNEAGGEVTAGEIVTACRQRRDTAPDSCQGAIDDWLFCLDDVPDRADSNADCDCNAELERVQRCS